MNFLVLLPKDIITEYILSYLGSYSGILVYVDKNTNKNVRNKVNKLKTIDFVNSIESIKWVLQNGCPWGQWTFPRAASNGNLKVLKFLRQNRCPWDEWTYTFAAEKGHLEVLKWLRQNGCPWDHFTCANIADDHNHLEVVNGLNKTSVFAVYN